MTTSFRSRLLRLLLLFSLVPAIIMALVALWLAAESFGLRDDDDRVDAAFLTLLEIQQSETRQRLTSAISPDRHLSSADMAPVDAVFRVRGDSLDMLTASGDPASEVLASVNINELDTGVQWFETAEGTAQVLCRHDSIAGFLCAAAIYPPSYRGAIEQFEQHHRLATETEDRGGYYFAFVALLLALILLSAALVAVVLSRRTSAHLAEPITATTRVVNDIARGDFTRRVNADAAGEIGVLIESVNRMAEQLDDLTQRLTQSERVAAWRGVARRFAHELKNPLQPIAVSLYQIRKALDEGAPAEKVRSPLASIDEEIRHLTKLAERFSALSKMPPPDPKTEDLAALVKSIGDLYAEKLTGHGFRLSVTHRPVYAEIDPTYLREAIHNLLKNAEEATEAGDQIELSLTTATGRAVISVKDHGRGMNSEQMASARLPYFTTKQRGCGLGLAVVEKVAADSGGRLDIESAPETGTTARLIIPLTEQSGDQREDTDSR